MKFVEFNGEIPAKNNRRHDLLDRLKGFMKMNVKVVEIQFDENDYKSLKVAHECIGVSIKRSGLPIKRIRRGDKLYLVRTDMD